MSCALYFSFCHKFIAFQKLRPSREVRNVFKVSLFYITLLRKVAWGSLNSEMCLNYRVIFFLFFPVSSACQ